MSECMPHKPRPHPGVYFKRIFALALFLRIVAAALTLVSHPRHWFFDNAADLGYLAQSLASGRGFSSPFGGSTGPSALITPGYPLLIALVFKVCGAWTTLAAVTIIALQVFFATLTVAALMHGANRIFGAATANLAGLVWAVSVPLLLLPGIFWETCLSTLLLCGSVLFALHISEGASTRMWLAAGAYCGVTLLVNPALIPAMLSIFAWAAFRTRPASFVRPAMGAVVMFIIFALWPIRNVRVMRAPILLRSSFGYELWQGNRPSSDGAFDDSLYPLHNKVEYAQYAAEGEVAYMRSKSVRAEAYIRARPGAFFWLTAKRVARFWIGTRGTENLPEVEFHTVTTLALGVLGLFLLWRSHTSIAFLFMLPLLLFPLPYYITDARFRYRFVVDPLMTILAAYAVTQMWEYLKRRKIIKAY
jgi:hypothetical protein